MVIVVDGVVGKLGGKIGEKEEKERCCCCEWGLWESLNVREAV